jgi:hypothetical protein
VFSFMISKYQSGLSASTVGAESPGIMGTLGTGNRGI